MIPYGRQSISKNDIKLVVDVLKSDFITQGPILDKFEDNLASKVDAKYAVASNSATSSLLISCLALGLSKGDTLWTSPNSFVASANCALHCGAKIDFVDIDLDTGNISLERLNEKLISAKKTNKLPKIIIPIHYAGQPTNQKEIWKLSKKYGFKIIEDASHSLGAHYQNEKVGSCKWSDITVFSFHPVKIITSCEGGISTTNTKSVKEKMNLYRSHGITKDPSKFTTKNGPWHYEQQLLGYNFRMSDVHAALGLSQLNRLDSFIKKRNSIAKRYNAKLESSNLQLPFVKNDTVSSFHLYVVQILNKNFKSAHNKIFKSLRSAGIGTNVHYIPIHLHPYYKKIGFKNGDFPNSEKFSSRALSLPIYFDLTNKEQDFVVDTLLKILEQ